MTSHENRVLREFRAENDTADNWLWAYNENELFRDSLHEDFTDSEIEHAVRVIEKLAARLC